MEAESLSEQGDQNYPVDNSGQQIKIGKVRWQAEDQRDRESSAQAR